MNSPQDLFDLLVEKRSGIRDVPSDRWNAEAFFHPDPHKPGHIHVRRGGFLSDIDKFDAAFFGISPNEARRMDPQQRLVLETAFRAIEDAGARLEDLAGRDVAVIMGCSSRDYDAIQVAPTERNNIGPTTNTGSALSIVANRVSYTFDLRGPSFTVDTACSSSLTAVHYACLTIWSGAAEAALAGGVNVVLKPEATIGFSKGGYLSPDAECRAFSDHANGYVRSEGAGVVLLKPLSAAVASGDRIYALIRGSWANQDGRTPGMTMPSADAQERMLRAAFRDAGVDPLRVSYVEAHGTGTPAGDPLEATAIGRVVGAGRPEGQACFIGSVKTNLGHMESAAGMAGLIKLALVLQRRTVFPNLHFRAPNPAIPFGELGLRVPTEVVALDAEGRDTPVYGGVNSFGFGGANAHVVLESPPLGSDPERARAPDVGERASVVFASARSAPALRSVARDLADRLTEGGASIEDVSAATASRRSRFEFRLAQTGRSSGEIAASLRRFAETGEAQGAHVGRAPEGRPAEKVGFIFSGQGPQWWGMGRALLASEPAFREAVTSVDAELGRLGWLADEGASLSGELAKEEARSRIDETKIAQPALFAVHLGIAAVLASRGVVPAAVVGHSIGELAAAVCAGALSLREATRIVTWRSRCQALAEGKGIMAAIGMTEREARELCASHRGAIEIAAVNGPRLVTVAGPRPEVEALCRALEAREVFCRKLQVSVPFHCHLMDPIEGDFRRGLGEVSAGPGRIPFYSTVTGDLAPGESLGLDYWYRNIREPVLFHQGLTAMLRDGLRCFVEISPHPVLQRSALETLADAGARGAVIPTLRHVGEEQALICDTLAALFAAGAECQFIPRAPARAFVSLPPYPFERQRFWLETRAGAAARTGQDRHPHPHIRALDVGIKTPDTFSCDLALDPRVESYIADHRVQDVIVFPGAGQLELVLAAARTALKKDSLFLEDVEFRLPIVLPADEEPPVLRLDVYSDEGHFVLASLRDEREGLWTEHTRGRINHAGDELSAGQAPIDALRARGPREVPVDALFRQAAEAGLALGPAFRGISGFWIDGDETLAEIEAPEALRGETERYLLHPALLDSVIQTAALGTLLADAGASDRRGLFLPYKVGRIQLHRADAATRGRLLCYARPERQTPEELSVSVWAVDERGCPVVTIQGLVLKYIKGSARAESPRGARSLYELAWTEAPEDSGPSRRRALDEGTWLVLADDAAGGVGEVVARALRGHGRRTVTVRAGGEFAAKATDALEINPSRPADFARLAGALAPGERVSGVVHLWTLSSAPGAPPLLSRAEAVGPVAMSYLVAALNDRGAWADGGAEVWLVTAGVQSVVPGDDARLDVAPATLWGFGRVLISEQPRLVTTLVDLGRTPVAAEQRSLVAELARGPRQHEIALRAETRHAQALVRVAPEETSRRVAIDVARGAFQAVVQTPGVLGSIALEEVHPRPLGPDEVSIAVRAVGLNFKDVVVGMAMLSDEAWEHGMSGAELGMDCAGVVTAVGSSVSSVRVGDEVIGVAPGCLGNRTIADGRHVVKKPRQISFADGAALPTVYLTAGIALEELARLRPGETVLIHAGAGGVGIAAIHIARRLGARVIATTSSEEKRAFLRSLGVEHIFSSRSPEFRGQVLAATGGRGVDVVLNSLSGRALTQGIRCLAPFGRFVEIGKTDIYANRQIGLKFFGENRAYFCLDVNRWIAQRRPEIAELLARYVDAVASGGLRALPTRRFPITAAAEAVQFLAQARQIGKVVVEIPDRGAIEVQPARHLRFRGDGIYLVTGGTSGFGLAVAGWLVDRGARRLVLIGRRGLPGPEEAAQVAAMERAGAAVTVRRCDVGDGGEVARMIGELRGAGRIAGIFHAAMVLDDAPLTALDGARYERVSRPKVAGAWNLHVSTADLPLDHFVMFSSIASIVGTPGQASYAGANAFLDRFAAHRRGLGLAATTINWGVLDGAGVVARASPEQRRKILGQGIEAFSVAEALAVLERALIDAPVQRVAAVITWGRLAGIGESAGRQGRFASLAAERGVRSDRQEDAQRLRDRTLSLPEAERAASLTGWIGGFVAKVAGLGEAALDRETSLGRLGFDSLMATQLQSFIESELGINVPLVRLLRGPTLIELAEELAGKLHGAAKTAAPSPADGAALVRHERTVASPVARLLCFPYMAGDGKAYAAWAPLLPPDVELCTVELPELGGPLDALLRGSLDELGDALADAVATLSDAPVAFYGHSMGGFIALDVARRLHARTGRAPGFIALGALPSLGTMRAITPASVEAPEQITEEHILDVMRRLGVPPGVLVDARVRARTVAAVRRDLWLGALAGFHADQGAASAVHEGGASPGVVAPILLFGGSHDPVATADKEPNPKIAGLDPAERVIIPGAHLFLSEEEGRAAICGHLTTRLRRLLNQPR